MADNASRLKELRGIILHGSQRFEHYYRRWRKQAYERINLFEGRWDSSEFCRILVMDFEKFIQDTRLRGEQDILKLTARPQANDGTQTPE